MSQINTTLSPVSTLDTPLAETATPSASSVSASEIPAPATAASGTPAPHPLARQANDAAHQLERLLGRATANGLPGLSASMEKALASASERPGFFGAGRSEYKALEKAAKACDIACVRLARVPLSAFKAMTDEAYQALSEYTAAQNSMFSCVRAFTAKSDRFSPLMETLAQATQFRASEALNLAATLMTSQQQPVLQAGAKSVAEGMAMMSPHMHGHALLDELSAKAGALFTRLDELEANDGLSPEGFEQARNDLAAEFRALKARLNGPASPGLQDDNALRSKLLHALDASAERLDTLRTTSSVEVKLASARRLLEAGVTREQAEATAFPPYLKNRIKTNLVDYEVACRQILERIENGDSPASIREQMENAIVQLGKGDLPEIMFWLNRVLEGRVNVQKAGDQLRRLGLHGDLIGEIFSSLGDEGARAFVGRYSTSLASMPTALAHAELHAMEQLLDNADTRFALRGEYLSLAVEHSVDLNTVIEARLRGFPPESVEIGAVEGAFKTSKVLGQGAANTVELCTYAENEGVELKKVFKPEREARMGLAHLRLSSLGYGNDIQTMKLNVASCVAADAIGCGGVVARSTIGTHKGRFGLFMEAAPGCTARGILMGSGLCGSLPDGSKLNWNDTVNTLKKNGKFEVMRANLMRECCRMEWADLLSGQVDRHGNNYLLHIDAETGSVKLTGIDNDGSFSSRKIGMTRVDVTGIKTRDRDTLVGAGIIPVEEGDKSVISVPTPTQTQLSALRKVFSFNQFFRPSHIDRQTYGQLMALDEDAYRRSLAPYMDEAALDAAILRLRDARQHATDLQTSGLVVEDWSAQTNGQNAVFQQIEAMAPPLRSESGKRILRYSAGFFARDLLRLFL